MSSGTGKLEQKLIDITANRELSLLTSVDIRQHDLEVPWDCRAGLLEQEYEVSITASG